MTDALGTDALGTGALGTGALGTDALGTDALMTEYLSDTLGWAFAEAVNIDGDTVGGFLDKLSRSGILADIEAHAPYCTTGCTGSELTRKVKAALGDKNAPINQRYPGDQGAPYWIGYYLGWYHCRSGRPFAGILARFPIEGWYRMYQLYHECGEEKLYRDLEDEMEKYKNTVKT